MAKLLEAIRELIYFFKFAVNTVNGYLDKTLFIFWYPQTQNDKWDYTQEDHVYEILEIIILTCYVFEGKFVSNYV